MDDINNTLHLTADYSVFEKKTGNRNIEEGGVKTLMESMKKHGFLDAYPIIVNSHMEVLDGQHRLEAAKRLGIPAYYTVADSIDNIDVVYDVNNTGRKWSTMAYIESRAELGCAEYQRYLELSREYPLIRPSKLYMFLSGKNVSNGKGIKTGNMLIDESKSRNTLDWIYAFVDYAPKRGGKDGFWQALKFIYDNALVSRDSLLDAFEKNGNRPNYKIVYGKETYAMLEDIESIYNYNRRAHRIFFTNEYKKKGNKVRHR